MKQYLDCLHWYATISSDPTVSLKELLKPPVVCHSPDWAVYDRTLYVRYGLLFQA